MSATVILLAVVLGLLVLSAPLFVIIGAVTVFGYVHFGDAASIMDVDYIEKMRELTDKQPLLAIPFFVFSGAIMSHGAIASRLVAVARKAFGGVPGGLGIATVAACMFFAAISGSSPVTVITIGAVMYPALIANGYPDRFSIGLVTSAGTLGILIPPSIPMIVYAIFASGAISDVIKVEEFFLAGIGPGMLIGFLLASYCLVVGIKRGDRFSRPDFRGIGAAMLDGFWALMLPVVILGGIYTGLFTAIEAAAVSVVYSLAIELWVHKELEAKDLPAVFSEATVLMGALLVIFGMAVGLNALLSDLEVPNRAAAWLMRKELTPFTFMLLINGLLLVVGCLMDIMSAIMILVPLLAPMAAYCDIDPIHFGVVFIVNLELGYLTPPMGLNLFVSASIFEKSLGEVVWSVARFTGLLLVALAVVTYVPTVALGPVNWLQDKPFYTPFPTSAVCKPIGLDEDNELVTGDEEVEAPEDGVESIQDMMNSPEYRDALGGDDDDDEEDEAPPDDGLPDDGKPRSIQELMDSPGYRDALDDE